MTDDQYIVRYYWFDGRILLPSKINSFIIIHFASAVNVWRKRNRFQQRLIIDFSGVRFPYSNGMLAIIAMVKKLRATGVQIKIRLPNDPNARNLFQITNWAYLLSPETEKARYGYDRHLRTRQFTDYRDIGDITNDFMDVVLRSMSIPKDIVSALEWSMYEICDNVINHSESRIGGFVEAVTYSKERMITFTVADPGRGILNSLREGIPTLKTDIQAIGEAIKAGVTRNKEAGQGNGLAGSLRITTMSGGSIDITSGSGRFYCTNELSKEMEGRENQVFQGTSVSGQIRMNEAFSIGKALEFNGIEYVPLNIIDLKYEMEEQNSLIIRMNQETKGVGTRLAGRQLRTKTFNLIESKPGYPIYVDWTGIPAISSSFADEFMGKLYIELGRENFRGIIKNTNMELFVQQLLDKAISQRLSQ